METKQKGRKVVLGVLALAGLLAFSLLAMAGNLEPSAPPGPTMKTLDEVEPRIPIPDSNTPVGTFMISESGSYYLTGDRLCSGTGIQVDTNDVTIDLMGYTLKGPDSGENYGIYTSRGRNVEIRNGTVRDFMDGIRAFALSTKNHRIIAVRSTSNGNSGIYVEGVGNLVKGCTASYNGTSPTGGVNLYGIYAGPGSTVTGNTAHGNGTLAANSVFGIRTHIGSTVTGNTVYDNGDSATGDDVYGILVLTGGTATGNTVYDNGDSATAGFVYGIQAGFGSTVTGNTACGNGTSAGGNVYGIQAGSGSTVTSNTAYDNGDSATGDVWGILLAGNNLVDQNTAYNNGGTNMNDPCSCTFGTNHAP
jgi:hypothetical protein